MTRKAPETGDHIREHVRAMFALVVNHRRKQQADTPEQKASQNVTVEVDREDDRPARVGYDKGRT